MKKAIILTHTGFQDHEVIYPYHSLKENGFEVVVVANQLGRFYGILGCHMVGDALTTDFNNPDIRKKYLGYDLLVVPGGVKALEKLRLEKGVVEFVREWNSLDKTILSLCNGAQLLITADVIRGKTVSGYYAIEADINNAGATYHRGPVVVDQNIVSSPHYDFMGEWMRTGYGVWENRGK
jgi:protease I